MFTNGSSDAGLPDLIANDQDPRRYEHWTGRWDWRWHWRNLADVAPRLTGSEKAHGYRLSHRRYLLGKSPKSRQSYAGLRTWVVLA